MEMQEGFVMITSLAWISKGYAKAKELNQETQNLQEMAQEEEMKFNLNL